MRTPEISTPFLREIILTPVEIADATDDPILDEFGNIILDETGLAIYEG
jgi:hypothetical protein